MREPSIVDHGDGCWMWPKPSGNVAFMLEMYGGWSRYFKTSGISYDKEHIVCREGDPNFWRLYERALIEEELAGAIKEAEKLFVRTNRGHPLTKDRDTLRQQLARALLVAGWKPKITKIRKEIAAKKRERRETIAALKQSLQKGDRPWRRKRRG